MQSLRPVEPLEQPSDASRSSGSLQSEVAHFGVTLGRLRDEGLHQSRDAVAEVGIDHVQMYRVDLICVRSREGRFGGAERLRLANDLKVLCYFGVSAHRGENRWLRSYVDRILSNSPVLLSSMSDRFSSSRMMNSS